MTQHKLDLLENALDSLAEALNKFEQGDGGDPKAYKFCVLHMAHFIELILKHYITEKHPLLVYANPFQRDLNPKTAKTIGLWEAVNFINNEDKEAVSEGFRKDLEWLKQIRNDIEHHRFEMDVATARITIGRLFRSVLEFLENYSDIDVAALPAATMEIFQVLSDEYRFKVAEALKEAARIELENSGARREQFAPDVRLDCESCGNFTMVINKESPSGFRCTFCGNEDGDCLPSKCDICGVECLSGELVYWEIDEGRKEARCYLCSGQYALEKDRS